MTLQQLRYAITIAQSKSMNEAAKSLYISQPSLSSSMKELERELRISIFQRTSKGVNVTPEGVEFLGYARSVIGQADLLEDRYMEKPTVKKHFGVSTQHYSFAVEAFVSMMGRFDMNEYEFAIRETRTADVIGDVSLGKSDVGVLYLNDFNRTVLTKILRDNGLMFKELFVCDAYVYMWKKHPLSKRDSLSMEDLDDYPCLCFEQGENNSFYFAEEILSTYDYKKTIHACDRATMLNLMKGVNGYTLCSGIISESLNGDDYICVPLESSEKMHVGYISRKGVPLGSIGELYVNILAQYSGNVIGKNGDTAAADTEDGGMENKEPQSGKDL